MAKADPRVTAGALIDSTAIGAGDEWSDVDVAFGIEEGISLKAILDDWTDALELELGALHYCDLPSGSSIYRVFLLPSGLEVDVAVTPQQEFGALGPSFHPLFGAYRQLEAAPEVPGHPQIEAARHLIGLGWHHLLHAQSSIKRGKPWRAEHWISGAMF